MADMFNIKDFQWFGNIGSSEATGVQTPTFNATDNKIKQIAEKQTAPTPTIRTKQKMFEDMATVQEREWVDDVQALKLVKTYYSEKGYTVEWMELWQKPAPESDVPWAFEDNRTFLSRIEEKARENVEREWEIDLSNRNVFRKVMDRTAKNASAFSGLVEVLIWEWFETIWQLSSLITPDIIEKPFKDNVQRQFELVAGSGLADVIWTTASGIWYTAKEVFNMLPEDMQQDVENLGVIWIWLLDLVWSGYVAKQWVVQWAKWAVYLWNKTSKTKNFLFPKESLNDLVAKASQAKTAPELKAFKDSISIIDTTKMNTYNDLWNAFGKKIWALSTKVDDLLSTKPQYLLDDLWTTVWKRQTNYVKSAIDDLKKVWTKENDLEFLAKVDDLEDILKWSEKDINDLAKFYWSTFKKKSFSKTTWEPLSSVSASRFENNRAWLKNLVRNKNWNKALKEIDWQISELYTAKWLVDNMGVKVQWLFNKTILRWPLAWLWKATVNLANSLSWGYLWWTLSALWLQSNIGKKTLDVLSIQKNLNKTLRQIDRMETMLDGKNLSNANKAYIDRFFADINSRAMWVLPKETPKVKPKLNPAEQAFKDEVGFKKADVSPSKTQWEVKVYRGQSTKGWAVHNTGGIQRNVEGWIYFTYDKGLAQKFWTELIETPISKSKIITVAERDKLQKFAEKQIADDLKAGIETEDLIEKMAIWQPKAFANYTKKPYLEAEWQWGWKWELIYYKDLDKVSSINTKWFINPAQIVDDIAKAWNKINTPAQIEKLAKSITIGMNLAKGQIKQAYEIVKRYIKEFGADVKDRLWVMVDEIADKIWIRSKFIDDTGKAFDDILDIKVKNLDPDVAVALRWMKWLGVEDIIKKNPDLWLKRDVPVTDIHWKKSVISKWEVLTPYELKGNKILLQDWETYIVSKSQYKNITQNSTVAEWKPFAPELKDTRETIKRSPDDSDIDTFLADEAWEWYTRTQAREFLMWDDTYNATKYEQYTLPWGKNYKEILIQAPADIKAPKFDPKKVELVHNVQSATQRTIAVKYDWKTLVKNYDNSWSGMNFATKHTEAEWKQTAKKLWEEWSERNKVAPMSWSFKSAHYDEPDIISTLRMNERTYKGKKVSFMEELQSDWAIEARKKGFLDKNIWVEKTRLSKLMHENQEKMRRFSTEKITKEDWTRNKFDLWNDTTPWNPYKQMQKIDADLSWKYNSLKDWTVPYNPLVKKWQEPTIKRWLKEAVDNDAEYFAWTTGNQQKARYSLSKEVNEIKWKTEANGDRYIDLDTKQKWIIEIRVNSKWKIVNSTEQPFVWKQLEDAIWKGIAENVVKNEKGLIKWEWLNIGWEWADTLYNRQVKNIVEDLTKGKVEMIDLWMIDKMSFKTVHWPEQPLVALTQDYIKVWQWVNRGSSDYQITKVLWKWKFEAQQIISNYGQPKPAPIIWTLPEPTLQPAIKLTPEIKRIIKWEAPVIKKASTTTQATTSSNQIKIKALDKSQKDFKDYLKDLRETGKYDDIRMDKITKARLKEWIYPIFKWWETKWKYKFFTDSDSWALWYDNELLNLGTMQMKNPLDLRNADMFKKYDAKYNLGSKMHPEYKNYQKMFKDLEKQWYDWYIWSTSSVEWARGYMITEYVPFTEKQYTQLRELTAQSYNKKYFDVDWNYKWIWEQEIDDIIRQKYSK